MEYIIKYYSLYDLKLNKNNIFLVQWHQNSHLNLSTNFPEHIVAKATLIENTRIFPELSLQNIEK